MLFGLNLGHKLAILMNSGIAFNECFLKVHDILVGGLLEAKDRDAAEVFVLDCLHELESIFKVVCLLYRYVITHLIYYYLTKLTFINLNLFHQYSYHFHINNSSTSRSCNPANSLRSGFPHCSPACNPDSKMCNQMYNLLIPSRNWRRMPSSPKSTPSSSKFAAHSRSKPCLSGTRGPLQSSLFM